MSGPDGFRRVVPTEAEREAAGAMGRRVYRLQCDECGARIWGSGLGIGAHRRGRQHLRPLRLREAERCERLAAKGGRDADWYKAEAARLRAIA